MVGDEGSDPLSLGPPTPFFGIRGSMSKSKKHSIGRHGGCGAAPIPTPGQLADTGGAARNIGTNEQQVKQFPPHKIIGNIYYVGTETLSSFLITTPQGHIVVNSTYERTVPVIQDSVAKVGFKFSDIQIVLDSHAHGDHQEGDAMIKELTGAQVMAMAEDIPALQAMRPGGKPHPVDRVLHDGDEVTLGGTTLVAHLTPGHTHGCTTWSLKAQEGGKTYDVVVIGSMGVNPGTALLNNKQNPGIAERVSARRQSSARASVRCAARFPSRDLQHGREVSEARQGSQPLHRS